MPPVLISVQELAVLLAGADAHRVVLLDVRWTLAGPPGRDEYLAGHLPGAVYVDLDRELAGHGEPQDGRHPLPDVADLEAAARRWGVRADSIVVVYDGQGNLSAARAWWLLRWAGLSNVRLLDGALPAWTASAGVLARDDVAPAPGDVVLTDGAVDTLDVDDVLDLARTGRLLDARAGERYQGEVEPIDPRSGHIPGAVSAPTGENLRSDGTFRSAAELRERFEGLGVTTGAPVAAYCGSGITAAHEVAALAVAGFEAALYPGSFSQWSNLDRPVATGP